jgi:hypothetical protein
MNDDVAYMAFRVAALEELLEILIAERLADTPDPVTSGEALIERVLMTGGRDIRASLPQDAAMRMNEMIIGLLQRSMAKAHMHHAAGALSSPQERRVRVVSELPSRTR